MHKLVLFPIAALLAASLPANAASGCDPLVDAILKVTRISAHMYMAETAGFRGGKTRNMESIYLDGASYFKVDGTWVKGTVSPQDLAQSKKEAEQKAGTCSVVRDEFVNGEPATYYKAHHQTADDIADTQIWVSKVRGLPLRQIIDIDTGDGPEGKSHTEIRYEYTNVSAPAVSPTPRH